MQLGSIDVADNGPHHMIQKHKPPKTSTCDANIIQVQNNKIP
jgi:hypothetical protein